jgi:hypothetical protein
LTITKIGIIPDIDNKDALSPIPLLVRVLDDVEQLPSLDVEDDLLE